MNLAELRSFGLGKLSFYARWSLFQSSSLSNLVPRLFHLTAPAPGPWDERAWERGSSLNTWPFGDERSVTNGSEVTPTYFREVRVAWTRESVISRQVHFFFATWTNAVWWVGLPKEGRGGDLQPRDQSEWQHREFTKMRIIFRKPSNSPTIVDKAATMSIFNNLIPVTCDDRRGRLGLNEVVGSASGLPNDGFVDFSARNGFWVLVIAWIYFW